MDGKGNNPPVSEPSEKGLCPSFENGSEIRFLFDSCDPDYTCDDPEVRPEEEHSKERSSDNESRIVKSESSQPVIRTSEFCLYPPHPNAPPPTTREKLNGCKTIFVGGLPENTTEEILHDIFGKCGKITITHMITNNFGLIRFADELCVDRAIYFTGHQLKIHDKDDALNNGRLHVDYAQARDYESHQCRWKKEACHWQRIEEMLNDSSSPLPVAKYCNCEAAILKKNMLSDDTFDKAVSILVTWMEQGECNKENSNQFSSLIMHVSSRVINLINEKNRNKAELSESDAGFAMAREAALLECEEVMKIFEAASMQETLDLFSEAEKEDIESMKKSTEKFINSMQKKQQQKSRKNNSGQNEGTMAQDHANTAGTASNTQTNSDLEKIIEKMIKDNDILRCQLAASRRELAKIKRDGILDARRHKRRMEALEQELRNFDKKVERQLNGTEK